MSVIHRSAKQSLFETTTVVSITFVVVQDAVEITLCTKLYSFTHSSFDTRKAVRIRSKRNDTKHIKSTECKTYDDKLQNKLLYFGRCSFTPDAAPQCNAMHIRRRRVRSERTFRLSASDERTEKRLSVPILGRLVHFVPFSSRTWRKDIKAVEAGAGVQRDGKRFTGRSLEQCSVTAPPPPCHASLFVL